MEQDNLDFFGEPVGIPFRLTIDNYGKLSKDNVLCLDCALGYWGLSTFNWRENLIVYAAVPQWANTMFHTFIDFWCVDKIDKTDCTIINDNFMVTNPERTICEMIKYDQHTFHLYEAIDYAYNWPGDDTVNVEKLERMAKEQSIFSRLMEMKEEATEAAMDGNQ